MILKNKILTILTVAALLLAGCASNTEEPAFQPTPAPTPVTEPQQEGTPIAFSAQVAMPATTRPESPTVDYGKMAGDTYVPNPGFTNISQLQGAKNEANKNFGVFGIYTGNSTFAEAQNAANYERQLLFNNEQLYWSTDKWIYDNSQYWPANESKVSFFAYAPYQSSGIVYPTNDYKAKDETDKYTYLIRDNFQAPSISYTLDPSNPKDVLWGTVREIEGGVKDINGILIKNPGDDYTDMRRPYDGALHWNFKHALARVRFHITNFLGIEDLLKGASATGFGNSTVVECSQEGTYNIMDEETVISTEPYAGTYLYFNSGEGEGFAVRHKIKSVTRHLVITDITLENFYKRGNIVLMNDELQDVIWNETEHSETPYHLAPLNPEVYAGQLTIDGTDYNRVTAVGAGYDINSLLEITDLEKVAINVALKKEDGKWKVHPSYTHYMLLIPQKYDDEVVANNIKVTLKYRIFTHTILEGNFDYNDTEDTYTYRGPYSSTSHAQDDDTWFASDEKSLYGYMITDLMPNMSYNIEIKLGEVMGLLFEVTDWDDTNVIKIPDFE